MSEDIRVPEGLTTEGLIGKRYLARVIDTIIVVLFIGVMGRMAQAAGQTNLAVQLLVLLVFVAGWLGYGPILESSAMQATFGKRLLGLRVYGRDGGRLTLGRAAGRNLIKDGPFAVFQTLPGGQLLTLALLVVHVVIVHRSPVHQALHDRIVGTWVAAP